MIDFIMAYWDSILLVMVVIGIAIFLCCRGKKQIVHKMLYFLVTEAEKQFGAGTGALKFSYVLEKIYAVLPAVFRLFVSYDTLEEWIEKALEEAKKQWEAEDKITSHIEK